MSNKVVYFYIKGYYVDFNKKVFSKAPINIGILKFYRLKPINSLNVFLLQYYDNVNQVRVELVKCS